MASNSTRRTKKYCATVLLTVTLDTAPHPQMEGVLFYHFSQAKFKANSWIRAMGQSEFDEEK